MVLLDIENIKPEDKEYQFIKKDIRTSQMAVFNQMPNVDDSKTLESKQKLIFNLFLDFYLKSLLQNNFTMESIVEYEMLLLNWTNILIHIGDLVQAEVVLGMLDTPKIAFESRKYYL